MLNRNVSLAVCLFLAVGATALGQGGTAYVVQLPGQNSGSSAIAGYTYNQTTFTPAINTSGPVGPFQVIAKPDGTKFFVLGSSSLQSVDPTFSTFTAVNGLGG